MMTAFVAVPGAKWLNLSWLAATGNIFTYNVLTAVPRADDSLSLCGLMLSRSRMSLFTLLCWLLLV